MSSHSYFASRLILIKRFNFNAETVHRRKHFFLIRLSWWNKVFQVAGQTGDTVLFPNRSRIPYAYGFSCMETRTHA